MKELIARVVDDLLHLTHVQFFNKYWWLILIIILGAVIILAIIERRKCSI